MLQFLFSLIYNEGEYKKDFSLAQIECVLIWGERKTTVIQQSAIHKVALLLL